MARQLNVSGSSQYLCILFQKSWLRHQNSQSGTKSLALANQIYIDRHCEVIRKHFEHIILNKIAGSTVDPIHVFTRMEKLSKTSAN